MKRVLHKLGKALLVMGALFGIFGVAVFVERLFPWFLGSHPQFPPGVPVEMTFSVTDWSDWSNLGKPSYEKPINSASSCSAIVQVLGNAQKSMEHQCMNIGKIKMRYSNDVVFEMGILPGHHAGRYEFRYNHALYSLSQSQFFAALQSAGVDTSRFPLPRE